MSSDAKIRMVFLRWIIVRLLLLAALLSATAATAQASDAYIEHIRSAASHIARGDYDRAVADIDNALVRQSGDPLVHLALGTVFLHTRQLRSAFKEFTAAHTLVKDHPLALYGFGIYYLAHGRRDLAANYFERASAGPYNVAPTLAYLSVFSALPDAAEPSDDPVLAQVSAYTHYRRQDYEKTRSMLYQLTEGWRGFQEEFGAVMTFSPAESVDLTGGDLSKPYKSPLESAQGLRRVSGSITLKADLGRAQNVAYVLFFVDGELIAMVNRAPFSCEWDTRKYSNAPHTVKIQGNDSNGIVLSDKSLRVLVSNRTNVGPLTSEEARRAESMLWECLKLKPSRRIPYYMIAKCSDALNDKSAALSALETTVAIDPNYKDARDLLVRHYEPLEDYREIWRVDCKEKLAALTFDDGPNAGTAKLLDVLKEKDVKATIFVVGSTAEANPDTLKRMASEGHEVQIHPYSHRDLSMLSSAEIEKELVRAAVVIRRIIGKRAKFFRPPGGNENENLASPARKYGFSSVFWTVDCIKSEGTEAQAVVEQVASETMPGSIILMRSVEDESIRLLPQVIDALRSRGYKLLTLSELLASGPAVQTPGS